MCTLSLSFNKNFAEWLHALPQENLTINNDGTITQKELGGVMDLTTLYEDQVNKTYHWELDLDNNYHFQLGTESQVNITEGKYTFHSHPIQIIEERKLKIGMPSGADFRGFLGLALSQASVMHTVVAQEGLYIISLSNELLLYPNYIQLLENTPDLYNEVAKQFEWINIVRDIRNLEGRQDLGDTPLYPQEIEAYVVIINTKRLSQWGQGGAFGLPPIFNIQFFNWDQIFDYQIFQISYPKSASFCRSCVNSDKYYNELVKEYAIQF